MRPMSLSVPAGSLSLALTVVAKSRLLFCTSPHGSRTSGGSRRVKGCVGTELKS